MKEQFSNYYEEFIENTYDCIDRIVVNAYNPHLHFGGGFRVWWRLLFGNDNNLDNNNLMRIAGHFSRRIKAYAEKNSIPIVYCKAGQRKDELVKEYIPHKKDFVGLFCIFVNKAPGNIMDVKKFGNGGLDIRKKNPRSYVNHYAFHIIDKQWGHIIIRFCPHPPFDALIILNGHEYVERTASKRGIDFIKEDNCFTKISNASALNNIADTMISSNRDGGRLVDVCERWIYTTCLCFALTMHEQKISNFHYTFSVHQLEYSRNLLFKRGADLDTLFDGVIDRTRAALDMNKLKKIFGRKSRPRYNRSKKTRIESSVEKPVYDLTVFKVHFEYLTLKIYSKGERILRFEAIVHNAKGLNIGKRIEKFSDIARLLRDILYRFMSQLHSADVCFIKAHQMNSWHLPTKKKTQRIAGINSNNPRIVAVMESLITLSIEPFGITTPKLAQLVREKTGNKKYATRHAAYDLGKFRSKKIVVQGDKKRTYRVKGDDLKAMVAYVTLKNKVITPVLNRCGKPKRGRKLSNRSEVDVHYENIQKEICKLFVKLKIAA